MKAKVHAAAGATALLTICFFWIGTALSELFGDKALVAWVKQTILWGMLVLIPAMVAAGASGMSLGRGWKGRVVQAKKRRMQIAAANGLLVLVPSAFLLANWAQAGRFDPAFVGLQAIELIAGAINITLLGLNMRDGLRLRRKPAPPLALSVR